MGVHFYRQRGEKFELFLKMISVTLAFEIHILRHLLLWFSIERFCDAQSPGLF